MGSITFLGTNDPGNPIIQCPCPRCEAKPGELCKLTRGVSKGSEATFLHQPRITGWWHKKYGSKLHTDA